MSLAYYRGLLRQRERIEGFRAALTRAVRPGARVLDVGTGLGTFAFLAARAGAGRVWAVDRHPVVYLARALATLNGLADRVCTVRGDVAELDLPEPVDVVVFEDFPARGVDGRIFELLRLVHARSLAADARFVPHALHWYLAPVRAEVVRHRLEFDPTAYGLDWSPLAWYAGHAPLVDPLAPEALAAPGRRVASLALGESPVGARLAGEAEWRAERTLDVGGLAYWFDLELAPGATLSNAPGASAGSWGHLVLPLSTPLTVPAGERLTARVAPHLADDGVPGWLSWAAESGGREIRGDELAAEPAGTDDLLLGSPDVVPALDAGARLEAMVLSLTDGRRTTAQIAERIREAYPGMERAAALRAVARILTGRARARVPGA